MRTGRQFIGDLPGRVVADSQLVFIDERIVDAIDLHSAELVVVHARLEAFRGGVMLEAESLEKILIDDIRSRADDGVDHSIADHVDEHFFQARANERSGQTENHSALLVGQHAMVNIGRPMQVARGESHELHRIDQGNDVVPRDIDVLDRLRKQLPFFGHNESLGFEKDSPGGIAIPKIVAKAAGTQRRAGKEQAGCFVRNSRPETFSRIACEKLTPPSSGPEPAACKSRRRREGAEDWP